ncbi:MAG: flagellar hook-associated protein FlgL [Sulfuriferula sp.]
MRISTSMIYSQGGSQISNLLNAVTTTQQQIAADTSILTPADNPAAAAQVLNVSQMQSMNTQFGANRQTAESSLNMTGSALSSVTTLLQSAKALVISAGDPTLTAADRSNLSAQARDDFNSMLALANATDSTGNYLFGGYHTATPPFVQTSTVVGTTTVTGAQYVGDQGQRQLQVSGNQQITVSASGSAMFQSAGLDIFKTLDSLASLLAMPGITNATLTTGLSAANDGITQTLNRVLTTSTTVGANLNQLSALDATGSNLDVQYSQNLTNLQGLDYAKAISQLTQQTTTLQAAQQSFVKISNLSLFNYIP